MNAKELNILLRNNTGNKGKNELIDSFVIRTKVFNNIISEIKLSKTDKPEQNYLVIGQRGAGKTTLLYRLKYAIEDDSKLNKTLIPIMFSEEQYNLMELKNLWESIAEYLEDYTGFESLSLDMENITKENAHKEEVAYELLEKRLNNIGKKIIVFIENIDAFFKKIGNSGQKRLREVLTTSSYIRFISSSTTYFEGILSYTEPFYEFFKIIQLDGLSKAESKKLLLKLAEQKNATDEIHKIIENHPKRLESLRRLTGGNPRIISYLFQIFLDNENGKAIIDLYKLLDDITFLYKAELDKLSAQQQKVIDVIARNWDAVSTKEISGRTGIDSKHVSSILKTLEKDQIVESIATTTKNNLYRLRDRFLNIWYLMRFGKKRERENVIWLVRFYDTWCDKSELSQRINLHIDNLKNGKYDVNAALDMGNVFLSCENVSPEVKYSLYQTTKSILPKELIKELRLSEESIYNSVRNLVKQKNYEKALEVLGEIQSVKGKYSMASWIYFNKGNYRKSTEFLEELYKVNPDGELAFRVAHNYETLLADSNKAVHYYELALKDKIWKAAYHLGQLYYYDLDNLEEAEKYHSIAIEQGETKSIMALATILFSIGQLEQCEQLVKTAISKGEKRAKSNLGLIYERLHKNEEAINTYEEAIQDGVYNALLNLGNLYMSMDPPALEKAKYNFEEAIKHDIVNAYYLLGGLYLRQGLEREAEECLLQGVKNDDADSAHLLGHFYAENNKWSKSERYFLKSLEWGKVSSLMCLAELAFRENKSSRREFIITQFEKHLSKVARLPLLSIEFAKLLAWNNQIEKSIATIIDTQTKLIKILDSNKEDEYKEDIITELTNYFILLMAKGQFNAAYKLFSNEPLDYKSLIKPVYYSLMNYMQKDFPNEFLKAGKELKETISEIMDEVENNKVKYND